MANRFELKAIAQARLKSAKTLIDAKDWGGATYLLCWSLEVGLKAVVCRTLHLETYPDSGKEDEHFRTHRFDRLLRVSGLEDIFGARGEGFQVWSEFTKDFEGEWPSMRYDKNKQWDFDRAKVEILYKCLVGKDRGSEGIFTIISRKRKW